MTTRVSRRQSQSTGAADYLDEVLGLLFPAPAWAAGGRPHGQPVGGRTLDDLTVLPSHRDPRVVLPRTPRRAAAAAIDLGSDGASRRTRLTRRLLRLSLRAGVAQAFSDRISILTTLGDDPDDTITTHLSEILGQPVHPSFRIGPARANRKPVCRLLDSTGRTVAFAKIGISELTNSLVRAEAHALRMVNEPPPKRFTAPTLLHHQPWHGLEVLVQSALPVVTSPTSVDERRRSEAMIELASGAGITRVDVLGSAYWARLRSSIISGRDDASMALATQLDRIEARLTGVTLPFGAWHGDWTPWNMAGTADQLFLWDLERYEPDVPFGLDALHYHFQLEKAAMGREAALHDVYTRAPVLMAPFEIDRNCAPLVMLLYAIGLAARYTRDFVDMGEQTWKFEGSPTVAPLIRFVTELAS